MAVSVNFNLRSQCISISQKINETNGEITMKKLVASLKLIRQDTERILTKFIESEKGNQGENFQEERGMVMIQG